MINLANLSTSELAGLDALGLALFWADRGFPVGPANPDTKAPWMGAEWQRKATTDPDIIRAMWTEKPTARVGIKTGLACGCGCLDGPDVIDFDTGLDPTNGQLKPGIAQRRALVEAGVLDGTKTMRVLTPTTTETGRGEHWYFAGSDQGNKQNVDAVWGVDLRSNHGWIVAPGNPGYDLKGTPWDELGLVAWADVAACPGLAQKTTPAATPRAQMAGSRPAYPAAPSRASVATRSAKLRPPARMFDDRPGEDSAMEWYSANHEIRDILFQAGWRYLGDRSDRQAWQRPGKEDRSESGNVKEMPDGRLVFYNFSSSTNLPVNAALSPAQLYAWLEHGGSEESAAKQIRTTLMPPPMNHTVEVDAWVGTPPTTEPAQLPAVIIEQPKLVVDFWTRRTILSDIRWFARERRVSPWAALGAVLALASCRIGPHVHLPPIVGGKASLNLLVGLVGPSGKGKGAATAVATEFLGVDGLFMQEEVGTSQGIDASFTEVPAKGGPVQFNDVAFFYVPEIDTIKAHAEMSGSALLPTLRKVWSGEPLGAKYAGRERRRPVRGHAYRASVVAGIQPKRSGVLLDDIDGGTPQRWLWLPVADPQARRRTDKLKPPLYRKEPPKLDFDVWVPQGERRGEKDEPMPVMPQSPWEIMVCMRAQNDIVDAREINLLSEEATIDSHSLLTRLKVAALLCFLDGRLSTGVTDDDWDLALAIMWVSNDTRQLCVRAREEAEEEENHKRGRNRAAQVMAEQVAVPVLRDRRSDRIAELGQKALGILQAEPGREYSPKQLREATMDAKTQREFGADVLTAVATVPGVVQGPEIMSGGRKIRKLSWTASDALAMRLP